MCTFADFHQAVDGYLEWKSTSVKTPDYTQSLLELWNIYIYILYEEECLLLTQTPGYHCSEKEVFDPRDELVHPKQNVLYWKQFVGSAYK